MFSWEHLACKQQSIKNKAYLAEIVEDQTRFSSLFIFITYAEVKGAIMR